MIGKGRSGNLLLTPNVRTDGLETQPPATLFNEPSREFGAGFSMTALQLRQIGSACSACLGVLVDFSGGQLIQKLLQFGEIHAGGP